MYTLPPSPAVRHARLGVETTNPATLPNTIRQAVASHTVLTQTFPGISDVEILRVAVRTRGMLSPLEMTGMNFGAKGTTTDQISAAKVYFTGASDQFGTGNMLGSITGPTNNMLDFTFVTPVTLDHGFNYF